MEKSQAIFYAFSSESTMLILPVNYYIEIYSGFV